MSSIVASGSCRCGRKNLQRWSSGQRSIGESYREFRRKVNQAELAEAVESAQQGERATVLDAAVPPLKPDSSLLKMAMLLIVGTFGLAAGIAVAFEFVDSVIIGVNEIEQHYRLPVLGSIGRIE